MVFIIWASALTLSSAFASWRSPITALKRVSPASTTDVPTSPVTIRLTTAATSSTICMKSWYCRTNAWKPDSFLPPASLLGPLLCNRLAASAALSPTATSTPSSLRDLARLDPGYRLRRAHVSLRHSGPRVSWLLLRPIKSPRQPWGLIRSG